MIGGPSGWNGANGVTPQQTGLMPQGTGMMPQGTGMMPQATGYQGGVSGDSVVCLS